MHKAGIVINDWKLPIFERHLMQSGYVFKKRGHACAGLLVLQVDTTNIGGAG